MIFALAEACRSHVLPPGCPDTHVGRRRSEPRKLGRKLGPMLASLDARVAGSSGRLFLQVGLKILTPRGEPRYGCQQCTVGTSKVAHMKGREMHGRIEKRPQEDLGHKHRFQKVRCVRSCGSVVFCKLPSSPAGTGVQALVPAGRLYLNQRKPTIF